MSTEERDNAAEERDEAGGGPVVHSNQENSSEARIERLAGGKKKGFDAQDIFDEETGKTKKLIRARKSDFVKNLVYLDGEKFDFTGREYLRQIYDAPWRHKVLVTGRQVEKTCFHLDPILMANGEYKKAIDVRVGDAIASLNVETNRTESDKIIWKSKIYQKPCLKIKTRLGHVMRIATTHPVRVWDKWLDASELSVGDRVATILRSGVFQDLACSKAALEVLAFMIGDGCMTGKLGRNYKNLAQFSQDEGPQLDRFLSALRELDVPYRITKRKNSKSSFSVHLNMSKVPYLKELRGHSSATKYVPSFVFDLSKEDTALFINRLWSTDGHIKKRENVEQQYVVEYCSISKRLIKDVQSLLWKFGIPSRIRENLPNIYKKRGQLDKVAYILRVETAEGVSRFLSEIGALGKSENITLPKMSICNNNRFTFPKEIAKLIHAIDKSREGIKHGPKKERLTSLYERGLRLSPKYPLSQRKIKEYISFFDEVGGCDISLLDKLKSHQNSDVYWDEIISIEDMGVQDCVDFTAENNHNYIVDGVITHNSTMLANEIIVNSCVTPYFKTLYVSTSHDQTRQFSNGKLKPWTEDSPVIQRYFINSKVSKQVFEKSFTNGSITFLRSAFLNADRTRGISADAIFLDEIQDMLSSNIPVILETASHSKYNYRVFAGTPKTLDNATEEWWRAGSMCEWLVPCHRHSPIHYNYLDEKCIGLKGPICNKCGQPIIPSTGQWVALSTARDVMSYRISQIMVPWIWGTEKGWKDFMIKYNTYSTGLFKNEVLGLSHDSATKPITRTELIACTSPKHPLRTGPDNYTRSLQLFAGIDWGEGSDGSERNFKGRLKPASYTVLTIGGFIDQRHFHTVFMKRYHGEDALPRNCVRDIIRICKEFGVKMIGVDWGHGWGVNDTLQMHFNQSQVVQFQYVGMQRERAVYDAIGHKIQLNRTEVMTDFFDELRARKWVFPPWEESSMFLKDVEHIFAEFRMKGDLVYDHKVTEPDDAAHSMIMCREAARIYYKGG